MSEALGIAAASIVFIYSRIFTMFNIIFSCVYGTEIWPQEVRSRGYSFTILDWAAGRGMTTSLIPVMLSNINIGYGAIFFFGGMNIISFTLIYFILPEVAGRSLEQVNLLFTSDSMLVSRNIEEYGRRLAAANGNVARAAWVLFDETDALDNCRSAVDEKRVDNKKMTEAVAVEQI